jgi:hypothetical protein
MINTDVNTHVYGNLFERNGYDCYKHDIYVKTHDAVGAEGGPRECINTYIGWNEFDHSTMNLGAPGDIGRGGSIEVQTESTAWYHGKTTHNLYIFGNYWHDGDAEAIRASGIYNLYFYNNLIENMTSTSQAAAFGWNNGASDGRDDHDIYVYNNTWYHSPADNVRMIDVGGGQPPTFKNNIFYAWSSGQTILNKGDRYVAMVSSNDLLYNSAPPSGTGVTIGNSIQTNPKLVNPSGHDFHLQASSPAIDAGTSTVSSIVTKDYDGNIRPQGKAHDIGAFEYYK